MTQTILGALRCLPLPPEGPSPWKGTVLAQAGGDGFFATILLPVAPYFYHALTPHLLLEGFLDNREWSLVKDCPTFCFATKISLGPETSMDFCKESVGKLRRFVHMISRIGSSDDEEFRDLVVRCPFLEEVRFRCSGAADETIEQKVSSVESAAFVVKKHPSALARASAARNLCNQMLSSGPAVDAIVFQLIASSPIQTSSSAATGNSLKVEEDSSSSSSSKTNYLYDIFNSAKKNFVQNGTTGSMTVFIDYIVFFTHWIYLTRNSHLLGDTSPKENPLKGFGGVYNDWAEIFDTIEVLFDSGDFKTRLSINQYGLLLKFAESIASLKNSFIPEPGRIFFWQVWKEHRDSFFIPLLNHAPLIDTREQLRDVLVNWRRMFHTADLDRYDCCKSYLFLYYNLIPDHYWYECAKSGASEIGPRSEADRLRDEDFTEMLQSGRRKFCSHMPFDKLFRLWDLIEEDDMKNEEDQNVHQQQEQEDSSSSQTNRRIFTGVLALRKKYEEVASKMRKVSYEKFDKDSDGAQVAADDDDENSDDADSDDFTEAQRQEKHKDNLEFHQQFKVKQSLRSALERIFNNLFRFYAAKGYVEIDFDQTPILFENDGMVYRRMIECLLSSCFKTENHIIDWTRTSNALGTFHDEGVLDQNSKNPGKCVKIENEAVMKTSITKFICEMFEIAGEAENLEAALTRLNESLKTSSETIFDIRQRMGEGDAGAEKAMTDILRRESARSSAMQKFTADRQRRLVSMFVGRKVLKWIKRHDSTFGFNDETGKFETEFMKGSALERKWYVKLFENAHSAVPKFAGRNLL